MNIAMQQKFDGYPLHAARDLNAVRDLVYEVAQQEGLKIEEALKWGQPSFLTKTGSTLRMDWSAKSPNQYRIYFNCKTRLVETFKEIYGDIFKYESNRTIVFEIGEPVPVAELKQCLRLTLKYHQLKQLPLLGV